MNSFHKMSLFPHKTHKTYSTSTLAELQAVMRNLDLNTYVTQNGFRFTKQNLFNSHKHLIQIEFKYHVYFYPMHCLRLLMRNQQ